MGSSLRLLRDSCGIAMLEEYFLSGSRLPRIGIVLESDQQAYEKSG